MAESRTTLRVKAIHAYVVGLSPGSLLPAWLFLEELGHWMHLELLCIGVRVGLDGGGSKGSGRLLAPYGLNYCDQRES